MKRWIFSLFTICMAGLTACGQSDPNSAAQAVEETQPAVEDVTFGTYKGTPIQWRILEDCGDGTYVMISEYALEEMAFYDTWEEVTWEDSTVRTWLNEDFISLAFTEEEAEKLVTVTNANVDHPIFGTSNGNDTEDKVWLADVEEVRTYFPDEESRICYPLAGAVSAAETGTESDSESGSVTGSESGSESASESASESESEEPVIWWLRSVGRVSDLGEAVNASGGVGCGIYSVNAKLYVRPMIRAALTDVTESNLPAAADSLQEASSASSGESSASSDESSASSASSGDAGTAAGYTVGDTVEVGQYAGQSITWRILENYSDGTYLLLSEYGIDGLSYDEDNSSDWQESDLRSWLNTDFLNEAFSEEVRGRLQTVTNTNPDNPYTGAQGCPDTEDTVWLLSLEEVEKYLGAQPDAASGNLICLLTDKAMENIKGYNKTEHSYNEITVPAGSGTWWLRSPGDSKYSAAVIDNDGYNDVNGCPLVMPLAVRPVIRIQLGE